MRYVERRWGRFPSCAYVVWALFAMAWLWGPPAVAQTVVAAGRNAFGESSVSGWTGITAISAGYQYTIGLKGDGTVVATGWNEYGQCNVSGWNGIVAIAAGGTHAVGLKFDGTVVAVGKNVSGQCDVSGWSGIAAIAAGWGHTVGLRIDGTVVAVGANSYGQCNVVPWRGITAIAAGELHTVGLRSGGTVVAVGDNLSGECSVSGWSGIAAVAAGTHTVGLKSDGTVVAVGRDDQRQCNVAGWSEITSIAAGSLHTAGLRSDGTVAAVGWNEDGQCNLSGWRGITAIAAGSSHTVGVQAPPVRLAFAVQPASAGAGSALSPPVMVAVQDEFGNTVTGATNPVTIRLGTNAAGGTLSGTLTANAVDGVATFSNLRINRPGTGYTLSATSPGLVGATSAAFTIAVGPPSRLAFTMQPPGSAAAGGPMTVKVAVRDAAGNTVTTATNPITIRLGTNTAGGTLSGTLTANPVAGVATFSNLRVNKAGTGYRLAAASAGLSGATSTTFGVTAGPPARLGFTLLPSAKTPAGSTITVRVAVQDANGNTVPTAANRISIDLGSNPTGTALTGTKSMSAVAGVATFDDLRLTAAGSGYTLLAWADIPGAESAPFNVVGGPAMRLIFTAQPANTPAGQALPAVRVALLDAYNNPASSSTNSVTVALGTNPGAAVLSGSRTVAAMAGTATFADLSLNRPGVGYLLRATSTGLTTATSAAFTITAAPPVRLAFTQQPAGAAAGAAIRVQVSVLDATGNRVTAATNSVNVALTGGASGATLSGTKTATAAAGVATFSLSVNKVGSGYRLSATSTGLDGATSSAFAVTPGRPIQLVFSQQPAGVTAGAPIATRVSVLDAYGNLATGATNSVTIALGANPGAALFGGTTNVAAVGGVATFANLTLSKPGVGYLLRATSDGLRTATSARFNVTAPVPARLAFTQQPADSAADAPFTVKVSIQDANGHTVTTATNSVTITLGANPGGAVLAGARTVAAVAGVATFAGLSLYKPGTGYLLRATSPGLTTATSRAFNMTAPPPARLVFLQQPTNARTGAAIAPAVRVAIQDALGNPVTTAASAVQVQIAENPGNATLRGTLAALPQSGVATFATLVIDPPAAGYSLRATWGTLAVTSARFNVIAAAPAKLAFTLQPAGAAAGGTIRVQVSLLAANGNRVSTAANSVTVALTGGASGATLSGTKTVAAAAGVATFNLSVNKVGSGYRLSATSTGLTGATSNAFAISPGAPARLVFSQQPAAALVGTPISAKVSVQDNRGNLVAGATNSVTIALSANPGGAVFGGTKTVAAVRGVATFADLTLSKPGVGYLLRATSGALAAATSARFNVTAAVPARLAFTQQPAGGAAGAPMTVKVSLQDAGGNVVTAATNSVAIALSGGPAGAALSGTKTVAAAAGVATFQVSVAKVGTGYALRASCGSLPQAISQTFAITAGPAARLAFVQQPTNVVAGAAITPAVTVKVQDRYGNTVTTATNPVSLAMGANPGGGTLTGTVNALPSSGLATFAGLKMDKPGTGYTLSASSQGVAGATSSAFNVTAQAGAATQVVFVSQIANWNAGDALPPVRVALKDANGNVVTTSAATVTVSLVARGAGAGTLGGTRSRAAVAGVALFSDLVVYRAYPPWNLPTAYVLQATAPGLPTATSNEFSVGGSASPPAAASGQ